MNPRPAPPGAVPVGPSRRHVASDGPCSAEAFEARYAADPDPWRFASSRYELGRYDALLAILGRHHYRRAYEPGCSVGVLTKLLARRCDSLLAVDVSATAISRAQIRCQDLTNVELAVDDVGGAGDATFDLVVLSEIGYYFEAGELDEIVEDLTGWMATGGELVGCHWTGRSADHLITGEQVHERIRANAHLLPARSQVHDGFLLETWNRR